MWSRHPCECGIRDRNPLSSIDKPFEARPGQFWVTDPGTGESLGQVDLSAASATTAPQSAVDAAFFALVADMAGAPRELVDTDTGDIAGRVSQSLYGRRTWWGGAASPLLFAGQYEDAESGWVYNRFRFYDPAAGVYGAQDPLGAPRRSPPRRDMWITLRSGWTSLASKHTRSRSRSSKTSV